MKTNKKFEFSLVNLTKETPSEIVVLQNKAKTILGTLAGVTWFATSPNIAGILAIAGAIIIEFIGCYNLKSTNYAK